MTAHFASVRVSSAGDRLLPPLSWKRDEVITVAFWWKDDIRAAFTTFRSRPRSSESTLAQAIAAAQDQSYPFAERWRSYNSWCGGAAGTAAQRILEDGRLGAPGGVRWAGYRLGGSHCAGVRIDAMGRRQRGDHLACHRARDVDRLPLGAARASR